jgi:hypothetical protein
MFKKIRIITVATLGILACGTEADFENVAGIEIETEELRNVKEDTPQQSSKEEWCVDYPCDDGSTCTGPCKNIVPDCCEGIRLDDNDIEPLYSKEIEVRLPDGNMGTARQVEGGGPCDWTCKDRNGNITCDGCRLDTEYKCHSCDNRLSAETMCKN